MRTCHSSIDIVTMRVSGVDTRDRDSGATFNDL
jgi:hypothetical protein